MFLWNAFCSLSLLARCSLREKQSQWSEVRNPGQNVETSPPRFRVFLKVRDTVGHLGCRSLRPLPQASTQPPSYFPIRRAKQAGGSWKGVCLWGTVTPHRTLTKRVKESPLIRMMCSLTHSPASFPPPQRQLRHTEQAQNPPCWRHRLWTEQLLSGPGMASFQGMFSCL